MSRFVRLLVLHLSVVNRGKFTARIDVSGYRADSYWI